MSVKDVSCKGPVGAEPLSAHRLCNASIVFGHVSKMVTVWIEDDVSIGLFETQEDIHHLDLPLYDDARFCQ